MAEDDADLPRYFVTTKTFQRTVDGETSIIIGPKGSGKTAILKALQARHDLNTTIVITPEVFATSVLRDFVDEGNGGSWDEGQAFTSTWVYTILIEVFRRLDANPRGVSRQGLTRMRSYLRDKVPDRDADIFTRFIGYLKRIESVKVGPWEVTIRTKELQELYTLAPLYELVPALRDAGDRILILLDDLDQGWDNSPHANLFIASLLQATVRIQSLGLRVRVVAFLRSEIYDLVKDSFQHLDKLRSSIEHLRWSHGELAELVASRIAYSLNFPQSFKEYELNVARAIFEGPVNGQSGFDYLLSRTTHRPREVLQFIRLAYRVATRGGEEIITPYVLMQAAEEFSTWKFEHLCSEYTYVYPQLKNLVWAFRGRGPVLSDIDASEIVSMHKDQLDHAMPEWLSRPVGDILQLLYDIDFIGIPRPMGARRRQGPLGHYEFAYERGIGTVKAMTSFVIHPVYWPLLEIGLED